MTREQVAALLKSGVLQAYAEGKTIQMSTEHGWGDLDGADFCLGPHMYRIKPEPVPHTFLTACAAVGNYGDELWDKEGAYIGKILEIKRDGILLGVKYDTPQYREYSYLTKYFHHPAAVRPFYQGIQA